MLFNSHCNSNHHSYAKSILFRTRSDFIKILKVAELLTDEDVDLPDKLITVLLKCLANSCVSGYLEKAYIPRQDIVNHKNIYKYLSQEVSGWNEEGPYPFHNNFPYDSVVRWVVKIVIEYNKDQKKLTEDQYEILRLSLQFLCNYFTFAFNTSASSDTDNIIEYIKDPMFKDTIM
jgi:hypothetical protein